MPAFIVQQGTLPIFPCQDGCLRGATGVCSAGQVMSHMHAHKDVKTQILCIMNYDGIIWDSTSILVILESMMHGLHRCWVPGVQEWRRKERQKGKVSTLGILRGHFLHAANSRQQLRSIERFERRPTLGS